MEDGGERDVRVALDRRVSRGEHMQGHATRAEYPAQLRNHVWIILDVLEDLVAEDDIDGVVVERDSIGARFDEPYDSRCLQVFRVHMLVSLEGNVATQGRKTMIAQLLSVVTENQLSITMA